ncbi:phenylalanine--tRNA ligase subunit beta [Mycoplasma nasistruthionis]|uniref:Phenylalanine--tRNA ligase beta subunit n=1 Tax=Mycoplasma nasistruthionis TaxID=353852 RepID=A0A4Y6I5T4_9MOLU|nr:phenylalanine--tRNA ligase subunit beta [Mycoplasma nasistruthionis]QDF64883.1 phenylalanine--tRNA ligase subunit beta [Mycoplasma nasistruthionis]
MILSLKHLNKFLPKITLDTTVEKAFNNLGFEVESVHPFSDVQGLVFAKVLSVKPNPNSDRLDVVEVLTKHGQATIQTTDRILKPGDLTICFPVGSSKGNQLFSEVKLKGIVSQGMFASWSEIGYDSTLLEDEDHVLVLPNDFAKLEDDPMELLGLTDYIIEISTTANRNDANSYYVLAKELAAYYQTEFKFDLHKPQNTFESTIQAQNGLSKHLSFIQVQGQKQTTLQEKMLLAKSGIDTKFDWAVNLTNLTLINIGVPTHVYDANVVNKDLKADLYNGDVVVLGNKELKVSDALAIYSNDKVVSLAANMGLEAYKVLPNQTNNYLFEIASFDPKLVRHTSKEIKLISNSAAQAGRVISLEQVNLAIKFIQSYCQDLKVSSTINPIAKINRNKIAFDASKLRKYANTTSLNKFNVAIEKLQKLGFDFENDTVKIPNYRYDVELFEDVIEEIFRFYSYDSFKPKAFKNTPVLTQKRDNTKSLFVAQNYSEVRTFTLVSKSKAQFDPFEFNQDIDLMTFVSKERETIRNSIVVSLQEVVEYNQKRKLNSINIFERGMINNNLEVYGLASTTKSFQQIKSDILNITKLDLEFVPFSDNNQIHPNVSAKILYNGEMFGWIGKLHPQFDNTNAYYAEFFKTNSSKSTKFTDVNLEPLKTVDLTFELDLKDHISSFISQIKQVANIYEINIIDDYVKFQSHNVTLRITAQPESIDAINKHFNKEA